MFERFTERARQIVVLAQEGARKHGADVITTGHLLLGLIREEEGLASRILASLDVTEERVLAVEGFWPKAEEPVAGQIPFDPAAKHALELALREALSLGHNYIGTEHILLGLTRQENDAVMILAELDIDTEKIRNETIRLLGAHRSQTAQTPPKVQTRRLTLDGDDIAVVLWALAVASCKTGPKAERAAQLLAVFSEPADNENLAGEVAALSAKLAVIVEALSARSHEAVLAP